MLSLAREMKGVIGWDSSIVSPFFRGCCLGSIRHNFCLLVHLSDYQFSIHPLTHFSAHPCMWLYIHVCTLLSSLYHPFLSSLPVFFLSISLFMPIHLSTFILFPTLPLTTYAALHPLMHSHWPVSCSFYPSYPFICPDPSLLPSFTMLPFHLLNCAATVHYPFMSVIYWCVHHPSTYLSSTYIIYLFFCMSTHTNSITSAYDYVIPFDKETAIKGLICLPFSPVKSPDSFKWTDKWLCIGLIG